MKIFIDPELKNEVKTLNFGIVEAGSTKEKTFYLLNDSNALLTNLYFEFGPLPEPSLKVVSAPQTLQPKTAAPLVLKWSPTLKFKQALRVNLKILGEEVYLSEEEVVV